jgi:hypothetical protein
LEKQRDVNGIERKRNLKHCAAQDFCWFIRVWKDKDQLLDDYALWHMNYQ